MVRVLAILKVVFWDPRNIDRLRGVARAISLRIRLRSAEAVGEYSTRKRPSPSCSGML